MECCLLLAGFGSLFVVLYLGNVWLIRWTPCHFTKQGLTCHCWLKPELGRCGAALCLNSQGLGHSALDSELGSGMDGAFIEGHSFRVKSGRNPHPDLLDTMPHQLLLKIQSRPLKLLFHEDSHGGCPWRCLTWNQPKLVSCFRSWAWCQPTQSMTSTARSWQNDATLWASTPLKQWWAASPETGLQGGANQHDEMIFKGILNQKGFLFFTQGFW